MRESLYTSIIICVDTNLIPCYTRVFYPGVKVLEWYIDLYGIKRDCSNNRTLPNQTMYNPYYVHPSDI